MIPVDTNKYKTEWHYEDCGNFPLLLKVDEDSSLSELEDEIEYWMTEIRLYELDGEHKSAIMQAVRWMTMLMERHGG